MLKLAAPKERRREKKSHVTGRSKCIKFVLE